MWFNDDDDDELGGGFGGQPTMPQGGGMPQGMSLKGLDPSMKLMLLGQIMQGGNPLQALTAMSQMQSAQSRSQYQQQLLALKKRQADATATYQQGMQSNFDDNGAVVPGGGEVLPTDNLPDPGAGEWGPPAGAPAGPMPGAQAGPPNPMKIRADRYRKAAEFAARHGRSEDAKRYADIANSFDPIVQEEWSQPQTAIVAGKPVLVQFNKAGGQRIVEGIDPRRNLTAPQASAEGMITMDQDTGQVEKLGVGAHEPTPAEIQAYQMAVQQGFKGSILDYQKAKAAAGASRVSLSPTIRVGNTLGETVAKNIAESAVKDIEAGHNAGQALDNVNQVRQNLPQAITGPLAEVRTTLARGLGAIGVGDYNKKLAATQRTVQGLARMSLDGAAMMEGQGQITQPERVLLDKASSAPQSLSRDEIMAATELVERVQRYQLGRAHRQANAVRSNPHMAPVVPHIDSMMRGIPPADKAITPSNAPKGRSASGKVTKQVKRTGKTSDGRTVVEYTDGTREYR